jgi:predicted O-methyltransferase YrrM
VHLPTSQHSSQVRAAPILLPNLHKLSTSNTFTSSMYEQDPRWSHVDEYTLKHLHPASRPNYTDHLNCLGHCKKKGLIDISAQPMVSKFRARQCRLANVKHALEVGTLAGDTAIWIASENRQIKVSSIEVDSGCANVARFNIPAAGLTERIEVVEGVATQDVATLLSQVENGYRPCFGFMFINADKLNN